MSNYVIGLVYKRAPYEDNRFNILLALADWSDDKGDSYPSLIELARKSRVSYRNTIYCIQNLEQKKVAGDLVMLSVDRSKKKGNRKSNLYTINITLLESLPVYWPESLRKITVQQLHRNRGQKDVENPTPSSAKEGNLPVQPTVQSTSATVALEPSCHDPSGHEPSCHDEPSDHDHDLTSTKNVENQGGYTPSLFTDLEAPNSLIDFAGARGVPVGGRWVRDERDPGGWSSAEIEVIACSLIGRELNKWDKRDIERIGKLNFSTELTIHLLHRAWFKSDPDSRPVMMKYYRVALERLDKDITHALREFKYVAQKQSLSRVDTFWLLNEEALREISRWEHHIYRS